MSIICVMSAIGFIYFRRKKTVTRTSLPSLLAFCGSMLVFTLSLIPLYSQPTGTSCKAMIWMQVLPFGVLMSSLIGKSWTDYKLIVVRRKNVSRLWVVRETVNLIVLAVEVGLLVLWSTLGSVSVAVVMTRTFIVEVCVLPGYSNPFGALLLAFNIILFCVASYLAFVTREAEVLVNESIFPSQICTTFGFLGMVVLPVLSVSEPGHNQIYIYGTAVWIAGLITMVAIVVPKAISIRADTKRINDKFVIL
ncbi:hypothetical protein BCR33DRAFT_451176 [Rhizoclosmatium globosum]|uniref:G-protein coupled receptors family 3 profile domain-containing protein n=1 Tax=Rhizoclosmatium globosum TaxID=329046 RepID=A0A1Y2CW78_9FUNG|nr:hypothetical protein BCR33DRAFT_451176 [Rhizoclosmatium globosum]|eukprot:ORY51271.1 hypothetical protein BCR33DRAFT_451176 [Rhizoclosmatium globosum]